MSQPSWNGPTRPTYAPVPGWGPQGAPSGPPPAWGPQGYGPSWPTAPPQAPPAGRPGPSLPPAPGGRRPARNPLRLVLLSVAAVAVLALAGLVAAGLTAGPAEVAYQNEDYQVPPADANPPPLPEPKDLDDAVAQTQKNPVYGQKVPAPINCRAQLVDIANATDAQLKAHFEGMMECLVRTWEPPVAGVKDTLTRPTVTIYGDEVTTPCGKTGVNAMYCSANQQVYYSNQLAAEVPELGKSRFGADTVIAHEFGHLVQARTGILTSVYALRDNADSKDADLNVARRKELQADCFAGMFLRADSRSLGIQQSELDALIAVFGSLGDDVGADDPSTVVGDHGRSVSRTFWGTTGVANASVGSCNTFVAPDSQVR